MLCEFHNFKDKNLVSLNPCFNGICSASNITENHRNKNIKSLNPCFNGICSARKVYSFNMITSNVLILVLMEYALRDNQLLTSSEEELS